MQKKALLIAAILMTSAVFGCNLKDNNSVMDDTSKGTKAKQEQPISQNEKSTKAPDFELKSVDGSTIKLSDYIGKKVILIDFWATWCPPCRKGIPDLIELQKKYGNDLIVIGISVDREKTVKQVPDFVKNNNINYPVVYFTPKVVEDFGGIEAIPTSFIINKKGEIVKKTVGLEPKDEVDAQIKGAM